MKWMRFGLLLATRPMLNTKALRIHQVHNGLWVFSFQSQSQSQLQLQSQSQFSVAVWVIREWVSIEPLFFIVLLVPPSCSLCLKQKKSRKPKPTGSTTKNSNSNYSVVGCQFSEAGQCLLHF